MEGSAATASLNVASSGPTPGIVCVTSIVSVILCTAGLTVLRFTRPSEVQRKSQSVLGIDPVMYRFLGVFGALLLFIGEVLASVPWLVGASDDSEGKGAAMVRCTLVLACWAAERYYPGQPAVHPLHTYGCAVVWFGSTLIEWAGPRPHDSMMTGLAGQIAGCDGGYRSPFLIYAPLWLTAIVFGCGLLCCTGGADLCDSGSDGEGSGSGGVVRARQSMRRKALPIIYGFAMSMSGFVFASGVERDVIGWVVWGAALLAVAVVCAWQWLWCLDLPLVLWALLSQNIATLLRLVQGHLIFRDFRWDPETEMGPLIVWKRMGIWFYCLGFFLVVAVVVIFLNSPTEDEQAEDSAQHQAHGESCRLVSHKAPPAISARKRALVRTSLWVMFALCCVFCVLGMTQPLVKTKFETPETEWVQAEGTVVQSSTSPGPLKGNHEHVASGESYTDLIASLYDKRLPCSAMVVIFNTVIRTPMQLGSFLAVMLRPSFVPARLLQSLQQAFIVDQAPGWFVGPMVLVLIVGFINQTGPGHSLFEAGFAVGFWFFLAFSTLSVLIAWTFQAFPQVGAGAQGSSGGEEGPRPWPPAHRRVVQGSPTREFSSDTLTSTDSDSDGSGPRTTRRRRGLLSRWFTVAGLLTFLVIVGMAAYLGLTMPFLNFKYRVSDVTIKTAAPPVLELWYGIGEPSLQAFAAFTAAGVLCLWVPLVLLSIAMPPDALAGTADKLTESVRRLELFFRPWVMVELWAVAVLLIYYILTSRNKGVIEVCAAFPEHPQGLLSICVVFLASKGLMATAKSALAPQPRRPKRSAAELPGGNMLWSIAAGVMFVFVLLLLYFNGPVAPREIVDLGDFNHALSVLLPLTNEKLSEKLPQIAGDCDTFWEERIEKGEESFDGSYAQFQKSCRGKKPLGSNTKNGVTITARWVTGVNSLEITDMTVRPSVDPQTAVQHWEMTIAGQFTDLHLWLQIKWGKHELINNYMCCNGPFHFSLLASADCTSEKGFEGVELQVGHMDQIEWIQNVNTITSSHDLDLETNMEVNYGSYSAVEDALRNALTMQTGRLMVRNPDGSEMNPLEGVGSILGDIVLLNTGRHCPPVQDSLVSQDA